MRSKYFNRTQLLLPSNSTSSLNISSSRLNNRPNKSQQMEIARGLHPYKRMLTEFSIRLVKQVTKLFVKQ
jgi:hypothetical protein